MNRDIFEEKWGSIRAQSKTWWSLFNEDDLVKVDKAQVKRDKYVVMLQVKYGYTREHAREEISRRLAEYEASLMKKSGSSNIRVSENLPVQSLVKNIGDTTKRGGTKPLAGSNKKQQKH